MCVYIVEISARKKLKCKKDYLKNAGPVQSSKHFMLFYYTSFVSLKATK